MLENSYLAMLGKFIEPVLHPLSINWMAAAALLFGFIAKEIVVGTFATFFGLGEEAGRELSEALRSAGVFTPVTGLAFMAFSLIYTPCIATVGVIYKETGSWKWTIFTVSYELILAYVVALMIVTFGRLIGFA
jgi:ferrous iron transport protein B